MFNKPTNYIYFSIIDYSLHLYISQMSLDLILFDYKIGILSKLSVSPIAPIYFFTLTV